MIDEWVGEWVSGGVSKEMCIRERGGETEVVTLI